MPEFYQRLSEVDTFVNSTPEEKLRFGDVYADKLIASDTRFQESPEFGDVLRKRIREDIQSELPEVEVPKIGFGPEFEPRLASLVGPGVAGDVADAVSGIQGDIEAISSRGFKENFGALGQNTANVLLHTAGIGGRIIADLAQVPHSIASAALEAGGLEDSVANQWIKAQYAGLEKSKEHMKVFHGIVSQYETGIIEAGLVGAGASKVIHKMTIGALNQASKLTATPGFSAADAAIVSFWTAITGEATVVTPALRVSEHYISESGYTEKYKNVIRAITPILFGMFSAFTVEGIMDRTLRNPLVVDTLVKGTAKGLGPVELEKELREIVEPPDIFNTITKNTNGRAPLESTTPYGNNFTIGAGFRHGAEIPSVKFGPETRPQIIEPIAPKITGNFHGTGKLIEELDDAQFSSTNYYGSGLYTTDSLDVAKGYSESLRTGNTPIVYNAQERQHVKVFDMEAKLSPEIRELFKHAKSDDVDDALADASVTNTRELYDFIREKSIVSGRSVFDVQEDFFALQRQLESNGFGAMSHVGGLQTNTDPHTVTIYFKPSGDIKLAPLTKAQMLKSDAVDSGNSQNFIADLIAKSGNVAEEQVAKQNYMDAIDTAFRNQDLNLDDARRATALSDDLSKGWLFGAEPSKILKELDDMGINGQENRYLGLWTAAHLGNEAGYVTPQFLNIVMVNAIPLLTGFESNNGEVSWNANKYLKEGALYQSLLFGGTVAFRKLKGGKVIRGLGSQTAKKLWQGVDHPFVRGLGKPFHKFRTGEGLEPEIAAIQQEVKVERLRTTRKLDTFSKDLKKRFKPEEREMLSDFIEKEGNDWESTPRLLQEQATKTQGFIKQVRELLVDSGIDEKRVSKHGDQWLHRVYIPHLMKKPTYKRVSGVMSSIHGHYLKRRGKNMDLNKYQRLQTTGLKAEDFQKGDTVYTVLDDLANRHWVHESQTTKLSEAREQGPLRKWEIIETGKKLVANTDYNRAEREAMGESRDLALRLAVFFREASHDISLGKAFQKIHANDEWTLKNPNKLNQKKFAKHAREKGFVHMPNTFTKSGIAKYGKLNNQWVHPDIKRVLNTMTGKRYTEQWKETLALVTKKTLVPWKIVHTAYNPSTHVLNVVTNLHLAIFGGYNPIGLIADGVTGLTTKNEYFQAAIEVGLKDSGVQAGDWHLKGFIAETKGLTPEVHNMPKVAKAMFKAYGAAKAVGKAPMTMYQWEDEIFKLGVVTQEMRRGKSAEEAMAEANKWFFDYSQVPSGVAMLRDTGIVPFISYQYKVVPAIARTLADHPERILGIMYAYKIANDLSYELQFGNKAEAQMKLERELQPEYQQKGLYGSKVSGRLRLKTSSKTGEARSLGISNFIPGADLFDDTRNNFPFSTAPLLGVVFAAATGRNFAFGKDIVPHKDPKNSFQEAENHDAWMKYMVNFALPNIPAIPYTYSNKRIMNGLIATGDINENSGWLWDYSQRMGYNGKNYFGNDVDLSDEVLSSLGFKISPLDVDQAISQKLRRQKSAFGTARRDLSKELGSRKSTPTRIERALKGFAEQVDDAYADRERFGRLLGEAR